MTLSPTEPLQANHRLIKKILDTTAKGKTLYIPSEFDRISLVFSQAGGSWVKLFEGSVGDMLLLKRVIKVGIKHGYVTKKESW